MPQHSGLAIILLWGQSISLARNLRSPGPLSALFSFGLSMELLVLILTVSFLFVYVAFKEWMNVAYRQWLTELDLFKRRLAAYEN